jgi:hypothetical protein
LCFGHFRYLDIHCGCELMRKKYEVCFIDVG